MIYIYHCWGSNQWDSTNYDNGGWTTTDIYQLERICDKSLESQPLARTDHVRGPVLPA